MTRVAQRVVNRNIESKFKDTAIGQPIDNTGYFVKLTDLGRGTSDQNERVGDKVRMAGLKMRFQLVSAAADVTNIIRVIIFQWHPSDAIALNLGSILEGTTNYTAMYNHDQGANFSIFYDRTFTVNAQGIPNRMMMKTFNMYSRLGRMKWVRKTIKYNAGLSTGQDNLYVCFVSDSGSVPHPSVFGTFRFTYKDA